MEIKRHIRGSAVDTANYTTVQVAMPITVRQTIENVFAQNIEYGKISAKDCAISCAVKAIQIFAENETRFWKLKNQLPKISTVTRSENFGTPKPMANMVSDITKELNMKKPEAYLLLIRVGLQDYMTNAAVMTA